MQSTFDHSQVHREDLLQVARTVKMVMENVCTLSVATPVKVKAGQSWGDMVELQGL